MPAQPFEHYFADRLIFDTAGACGEVKSVEAALIELPTERMVRGTDYP